MLYVLASQEGGNVAPQASLSGSRRRHQDAGSYALVMSHCTLLFLLLLPGPRRRGWAARPGLYRRNDTRPPCIPDVRRWAGGGPRDPQGRPHAAPMMMHRGQGCRRHGARVRRLAHGDPASPCWPTQETQACSATHGPGLATHTALDWARECNRSGCENLTLAIISPHGVPCCHGNTACMITRGVGTDPP